MGQFATHRYEAANAAPGLTWRKTERITACAAAMRRTATTIAGALTLPANAKPKSWRFVTSGVGIGGRQASHCRMMRASR